MRILQVIAYFNPRFGGDVACCYNISKYLANLGHDVTIITSDFQLDLDYVESLPNVEVIAFRCLANLFFFLYSPSTSKWIKYNIKDYDIIYIHGFRTYQNSRIHKYAKKFNIPYILQAHGDVPRIMGKKNLKRIFDLVWGYSILQDASKLLALTTEESNQYISMGIKNDRIEIIPNGLDLEAYNFLPIKGNFRKRYYIEKSERIILYLGRIHKIKGIDILIDAFSELICEYKNSRLVIVGPDEGFYASLERKVISLNLNDKVLFTGPLYGEEKLEAYVDADIYVLPSLFDTFPTTVIEAIYCGTPVVISNRCGLANFIDGKAGIVVSCDSRGLKEGILKILSNESLAKVFSNNGVEIVIREFDELNVSKRIETLMYDIINKSDL